MRLLAISILVLTHQCLDILAQPQLAQPQFRSECCEDYCYSTDSERPQTRHFTSKTAYEIVKGADYGKQYTVPYCRPVKFWMLSRHGTRLPDLKTIRKLGDLESIRDEIIKNYEVRKTKPLTGALCPEDYQLIKNWAYDRNITEDHSNYLTVQGWSDLKFLAKNYQRIFPDVLSQRYSPEKFNFRHTDTQRTRASFKAFADGLFGDDFYKNINLPPPPSNDTLLLPYSNCNLWNDQNDKKDEPGSEIDKFKNSLIMRQTLSDISMRLGFQYTLEYKQIELIWDICRYEQAWFLDRPSAWCTAFTLSEIEVLEYSQDLMYQYKSGYASEINENVPCEIIQDMLKRLNSNEQPQVSAYFGHTTIIELFLVALGAYKDSVLLNSDNYQSMGNRKWRTSLLDPFAANLAVIKYDCSQDTNDPSPKVIFFLNQTPLQLSWCSVGLCKWSDVMSRYEKFSTANCKDFFCSTSSGSFVQGSIALIFTSIVYRYFF